MDTPKNQHIKKGCIPFWGTQPSQNKHIYQIINDLTYCKLAKVSIQNVSSLYPIYPNLPSPNSPMYPKCIQKLPEY